MLWYGIACVNEEVRHAMQIRHADTMKMTMGGGKGYL
jgi:hypothetical protein